MRYKKRITKMYDESMFVSDDEIASMAKKQKKLKPKQYDPELKEELKTLYFPIWEELSKKYYSEEMSKRILQSLSLKLEPTNTYSVANLASQMEAVFGILELARTGDILGAEALYLASGSSHIERNMKLINYLSTSYYAKELMNVMSKDIMQVFFNESRAYHPEIKRMKANAEHFKKQGTAEMQAVAANRNSAAGPSSC